MFSQFERKHLKGVYLKHKKSQKKKETESLIMCGKAKTSHWMKNISLEQRTNYMRHEIKF